LDELEVWTMLQNHTPGGFGVIHGDSADLDLREVDIFEIKWSWRRIRTRE
jgi:hypothetical protein